MIVRDANIARTHAFGAHLFEKPCRWHFAFYGYAGRQFGSHARRQFSQQVVLKNTAGAFHGGRVFAIACIENMIRFRAHCPRVTRLHCEFGREDDPRLIAFENAVTIAELTAGVVDFAYGLTVKKTHGGNAFHQGMTIGTGIAVDRATHQTGNSGHRLQTLQAASHGEIDKPLEHKAAVGEYEISFGSQGGVRQLEHHSAKAGIRNNQIGAATRHNVGEFARPHDLERLDE